MEHQSNTNANATVPLRNEFNRNKENETSTNENKYRQKTKGRSIKYHNAYNGIISTSVKLCSMSMSVMRQI